MPLFARHDVVLVADTATPATDALVASLSRAALDVLVLVTDPAQRAAAVRTTPWLLRDEPPTVLMRRRWGGVRLDPVVFGPRFGALHGVVPSPDQPMQAGLLEALVRHAPRAIVVTRWWQVVPAAIAADHLGAALLCVPTDEDVVAPPAVDQAARQLLPILAAAVGAAVLLPPEGDRTHATSLLGDAVACSTLADPTALPAEVSSRLATRHPRDLRADHPGVDWSLPPDGRPLLTIAIPTYKRAAFLADTLASVLGQVARYRLGGLVEIVVSDNASPDATPDIVARAQASGLCTVRHSRNDVNRGVGYNVVRALELARGHFCCLLGDDDFIVEGALPTLLQGLRAPDPVRLVAFAGGGLPFPHGTPTRLGLLDVARDFFYHVGNLGLAVVRTDPVHAALARHGADGLQRFWPQTQLYFLAMAQDADAAPALAIPHEVAYGPLHGVLTTYTGRYLFDEGVMSLLETAMRLAPHMPATFMSTVLTHYWAPRWGAIRSGLVARYASQDAPEARDACLATIADAIALVLRDGHVFGDAAGDVLRELAETHVAYAEAAGPDVAREAHRQLEALLAATAP